MLLLTEFSSRPFLLELINAHRVYHTYDAYREMENKINNSTKSIAINRLQRIPKYVVQTHVVTKLTLFRSLTGQLKEGEETKRKTYRCVVWVEKAIQPSDLEFLNNIKDLEISQKTPVRVLHR